MYANPEASVKHKFVRDEGRAVSFEATPMKVLITAPSLDNQENVSGISTMIASIIESAGDNFVHFAVGRKDVEKFDLGWVRRQVILPFSFRRAISRSKPDVVHINTSFEPRSIMRDLVLAKSAGKRPILLHVHGGRFVMQDPPNGILATMSEKLLRSASRVVVLGEAERERLITRTPDIDVSVLPNAVATAQFSDGQRSQGAKTIIYIGRLHEDKGLSEMVETCRVLAAQGFKFRFSCFGAGRDQERFTRAMTEVLGDSFHYGGIISGEAKINALCSADIFLMPSRYEGLSMALLEAMAAGCVPIVSNRGAIPSVIEDGRNGFMIDPGDVTQVIGRLKYLLSEGERGWDEYRRNARKTVRERFDIGGYVEKLNAIYRDIAAPK